MLLANVEYYFNVSKPAYLKYHHSLSNHKSRMTKEIDFLKKVFAINWYYVSDEIFTLIAKKLDIRQ